MGTQAGGVRGMYHAYPFPMGALKRGWGRHVGTRTHVYIHMYKYTKNMYMCTNPCIHTLTVFCISTFNIIINNRLGVIDYCLGRWPRLRSENPASRGCDYCTPPDNLVQYPQYKYSEICKATLKKCKIQKKNTPPKWNMDLRPCLGSDDACGS